MRRLSGITLTRALHYCVHSSIGGTFTPKCHLCMQSNHCRDISVSLSLSLCLCLSISVSLSVSLCLSLSLSLSVVYRPSKDEFRLRLHLNLRSTFVFCCFPTNKAKKRLDLFSCV